MKVEGIINRQLVLRREEKPFNEKDIQALKNSNIFNDIDGIIAIEFETFIITSSDFKNTSVIKKNGYEITQHDIEYLTTLEGIQTPITAYLYYYTVKDEKGNFVENFYRFYDKKNNKYIYLEIRDSFPESLIDDFLENREDYLLDLKNVSHIRIMRTLDNWIGNTETNEPIIVIGGD